MDEPLSNLDAKLRVQMRTEITKLHQKLQTTFIYVTHDQTEAMTMGTRIVVMKDGIIQQVESPVVLYNRPDNLFVAGFIGSPQMNFIVARIEKDDEGRVVAEFGKRTQIVLPEDKVEAIKAGGYMGKEVYIGIRPENISDQAEIIDANPLGTVNAKVEVVERLGAETLLYLIIDGNSVTAKVHPSSKARPEDNITVAFDIKKMHIFDKETEVTICH